MPAPRVILLFCPPAWLLLPHRPLLLLPHCLPTLLLLPPRCFPTLPAAAAAALAAAWLQLLLLGPW